MGDQRWGRLSTRITLVTGLAVCTALAIMIALISRVSYNNAVDMGYKLVQGQARAHADSAEADFRLGFALPKHLQQLVNGIRRGGVQPDRHMIGNIHLELLDNALQAVGLWMVWEPNAFDKNDKAFRFNQPYEDYTGRYTPYFTRNAQGKAQIDIMLDAQLFKDMVANYKNDPDSFQAPYEKSGWGDFFFVPKTRNRDTITEPYPYEVQGKKVLQSSLAVAMKDASGKFLGVSAIDIALSDLQKRFSQIHPYDT